MHIKTPTGHLATTTARTHQVENGSSHNNRRYFFVLSASLIAEASVYQTIVTRTEINEPSISDPERCRRELSGMRMDSCRRHLQPYVRHEYAQPCCQELQQVNDPQCRCEALRQTAQRVPGYEQEQQQVTRLAQELADLCKMEELRYCQIGQQGY
ncbi:hypothetical protein FRX31_002536 [Thalictrum thalictroides]|uniref:Bifunctional inhibitor/plant lipid transfer protein/seed storage helical domain-containing protein n=1 Tax=Thalictrum thalictroides TaxID=46969 RepID=A0A7J6XE92_THATH|nr:hypothetical protein FRX31_002536 [Thalictrum thalictroides]